MIVGRRNLAPASLVAISFLVWGDLATAGGGEHPPALAASGSVWNGFYVGAGLGTAWGDATFEFAGGLPVTPNPFDLDSAIVGGVHFGYQRQWGHMIAGLETSVLFTNLEGRSSCPNPAFACSVDADWIWMIGPRLGFATRNLLFYGTGGYALASLETKTVTIATGAVFDTGRERNGGWYLGGGMEWSIGRAMSLGVEYRRIELDEARLPQPRFLPAPETSALLSIPYWRG